MPPLRRTALLCCFWCLLLNGGWASADEEGLWGTKPPTEKKPPPQKGSSWLPSFSSLSSYIPFRTLLPGSSDVKSQALTTIAEGLADTSEYSGRDGESEAAETPTASTRRLPINVTEIGLESLPTASSDTGSHNDTLVSYSHSPTGGSDSPATTRTNAPEQSATPHSRPPPGAAHTARPVTTAAARHFPRGTADTEATESSTGRISAPETTAPTPLTRAAVQATTTKRGPEETKPPVSPENMSLVNPTMGFILHTGEATATETGPTQSEAYLGASDDRSGPAEQQPQATGIDGKTESIASTTPSLEVNSPITTELPHREEEEESGDEGAAQDGGNLGEISTLPEELLTPTTTPPTTPPTPQRTGSTPNPPHFPPDTEVWTVDSSVTFLPDCNRERSGICNVSDTWDSSAATTTTATTTTPSTTSSTRPTQNTTAANQSTINPFLIPAPPMLVPLYTDWNSAMAAWGLAWEAHVYGAGCVFAALTLASALNLLCLPLRCPSGCGYFALVSLFLLVAGATRSFSLLYDAYGHQDRLPFTEASLLLYEAPFPCLTAAFGLVFLLLSMRSRMQLSYSAFQRPCFLACLVLLHFAAAFGPVTLLKFYQQRPPLCLFLSLISRGAFVVLATFLSAAYFVFYIYVRADSKHIYHLNNTSPTPAERYNRCPFAESRDWDRAAVTACLSALFSLACAGLQLYAMLNAMGVAGGEEVFHPWPWWAFQFSCRVCELGVCLTLALVVAQPVYCSDHLSSAGSCWTELLASKSPILPGSYQWTLSQQEKLAIVDTSGLGETESLPLYTLMDERLGNSLNGLDLLYHSNHGLAYRDLDLQGKPDDGGGREPSGASSFTSDSTTDLRPPSPINLRRSIDEALFSEALFPVSLFSPTLPPRLSDLSANRNVPPGLLDSLSAQPGLYRTSSCAEVAGKTQPEPQGAPLSPATLSTSSSCSSPERWRGSSSSCAAVAPNHAEYKTLGAASQESLDLDMSSEADRSVQEEFVSVCRQIDALSICSETIDL